MAIEFEAYGPVEEERLRDLERRLGFGLPGAYRRWLAGTNGGYPLVQATLPDQNFVWDERAFGLRPDDRRADLAHRYEYFSDRLPPAYLPVTSVQGGLLAVRVGGEGTGSVWFWDDDDPGRSDDSTPEELEALLRFCGRDWDGVLARLVPASGGLSPEEEEAILDQIQIID